MTPAEFRAFLERMGWGVREAARRMRVDPAAVVRWTKDEGDPYHRAVPPYIALLCELLERERSA